MHRKDNVPAQAAIDQSGMDSAGMDAQSRMDADGVKDDPFLLEPITNYCDLPEREKLAVMAEVHSDKPFQIVGSGCKCSFCGDCAVGKGLELRKALQNEITSFKSVMFLTLTVDPKQFKSAQEAYEFVHQNRCVSRLMRALSKAGYLHSKRWFSVLEFQKNGNPHWHLIVDSSFVPKSALQGIWDRMSRTKTMGYVRFDRTKMFADKAHAANYVTKYVIKSPDEWPEWVRNYRKRIRRYSTSRGLLGLTKRKPPAEKKRTRKMTFRTIAERVSRCKTTTVLIAKVVKQVGAELVVKKRFVAKIQKHWDDVKSYLGEKIGNSFHLSRSESGSVLNWASESVRVHKDYVSGWSC